ncbi:hypothetical protein BV898_19727, partial [Hypsibius exemplaris]
KGQDKFTVHNGNGQLRLKNGSQIEWSAEGPNVFPAVIRASEDSLTPEREGRCSGSMFTLTSVTVIVTSKRSLPIQITSNPIILRVTKNTPPSEPIGEIIVVRNGTVSTEPFMYENCSGSFYIVNEKGVIEQRADQLINATTSFEVIIKDHKGRWLGQNVFVVLAETGHQQNGPPTTATEGTVFTTTLSALASIGVHSSNEASSTTLSNRPATETVFQTTTSPVVGPSIPVMDSVNVQLGEFIYTANDRPCDIGFVSTNTCDLKFSIIYRWTSEEGIQNTAQELIAPDNADDILFNNAVEILSDPIPIGSVVTVRVLVVDMDWFFDGEDIAQFTFTFTVPDKNQSLELVLRDYRSEWFSQMKVTFQANLFGSSATG